MTRQRTKRTGRPVRPDRSPQVRSNSAQAPTVDGRSWPTIALCMIVRNEAENLPRCLESARGLVDDLVVVDTGSTDGTVAIARQFGARIFEFAWTGDFAAARNFSIEQAAADWILYLDADEALDPKTAPNLRRLVLLPHDRPRAIALPIRNHLGEPGRESVVQHYAARLFVRHPRVRLHRPIHEDVTHLDGADRIERVVSDDVIIDHFGYRQRAIVSRQKAARNLAALETAVMRGGDAYDYYLLARERFVFGNLDGAVEALETMLRLAPSEEPLHVGEGYSVLVAALNGLGRLDEAVTAGRRGLRIHDYTDLWHSTATALLARGELEAAIAGFRQALARRSDPRPYARDLSIGAWRSWLGLGEAHRQQGDLASADGALREALAAAPLERDVVLTAAVVACLAGRPADAVTMVERYLEACPSDELLARLLADVRRSQISGGAALARREARPCRR